MTPLAEGDSMAFERMGYERLAGGTIGGAAVESIVDSDGGEDASPTGARPTQGAR